MEAGSLGEFMSLTRELQEITSEKSNPRTVFILLVAPLWGDVEAVCLATGASPEAEGVLLLSGISDAPFPGLAVLRLVGML